MIKTLSRSFLIPVTIFASVVAMTGCTNFHQSIGDSFGSYPKWLFGPKGHYYKSVGYRWDYENTALVYIYRPISVWAMDEVEAPSFNVNNERLFNFKGGGYTWYEMEPGIYDIVVRRGIFGLEGIGDFVFAKYSDFDFQVEAGKVYYLRYSEIDPVNVIVGDNGLTTGDGPLQLVPHSLAMKEMEDTKMIHHGRDLITQNGRKERDLSDMADASTNSSKRESSSNAPTPAKGGIDAPEGLKAKPRSEQEEWWPF
ncbi:MAG: DUF2846 domain-containing protein [Thalassolituus sp.]|uniref:DUF2846 domain-containing protein n=1 Tax=Thalassolituus sp. TaxID=2030822 RepID=UPI003982303B